MCMIWTKVFFSFCFNFNLFYCLYMCVCLFILGCFIFFFFWVFVVFINPLKNIVKSLIVCLIVSLVGIDWYLKRYSIVNSPNVCQHSSFAPMALIAQSIHDVRSASSTLDAFSVSFRRHGLLAIVTVRGTRSAHTNKSMDYLYVWMYAGNYIKYTGNRNEMGGGGKKKKNKQIVCFEFVNECCLFVRKENKNK